MVIDDSRATRVILGRILQQLGYQVTDASNGREGLERLRGMEPPDLALVDWNMPEVNGYEFVCSVRSDPRFARMRLIMTTTETEIAQVSSALDAGADEAIIKPFTPDALAGKIDLLGLARC